MNSLKEIQKKILILGDGSVGKTSLIRRLVVDKFDDRYIATIGTKITAKDLQVEMDRQKIYLKLQIWDILGQKGYRKLYNSSFRGVDGIFMVADITRKDTLMSLKNYWIPLVNKVAGVVPFVILANKSDLIERAEFNENDLKEFASVYKVPSYPTSAKCGETVQRAFEILGKRMIRRRLPELPKSVNHIPIEGQKIGLSYLVDIIMDDFCKEYGSIEDAMPILRRQFELVTLDPNNPRMEDLIRAVDRLADFEMAFKNKDVVEANRARRLRWIKEAN